MKSKRKMAKANEWSRQLEMMEKKGCVHIVNINSPNMVKKMEEGWGGGEGEELVGSNP